MGSGPGVVFVTTRANRHHEIWGDLGQDDSSLSAIKEI